MAEDNSLASQPPRHVKPKDQIGSFSEGIGPTSKAPIGHPVVLTGERDHVSQPVVQWSLRAGATFIPNHVEVVVRNIQDEGKPGRQRGLAPRVRQR